jgi:hypothetical protein
VRDTFAASAARAEPRVRRGLVIAGLSAPGRGKEAALARFDGALL